MSSTLDYFSSAWLELVLASVSAIVYLIFSKKSKTKKSEKTIIHQKSIDGRAGHTSSPSSSKPSSPRSSSGDDNLQATKDSNSKATKKIAMRANDIRSCGRNGNINGAIKVFERLEDGADNTLVLNSMLDACVECHDLEKALFYFNRARCLELADVTSYNKMMKGHLAQGQEAAAKRLLAELVSKGAANSTSFHGPLNARVNAGDLRGAWKLVAEMQFNGINPNAVTCAILLKGRLQSIEEVSRVLVLVDAMQEPMDEVLFMAVAEACVRIGRLDVLSRQMEKFKRQGTSKGALSPETYGSMIKAYGRARDTKRVWDLWNQMVNDGTQLTSVTLGCMVEALVANGQSQGAWELVQDLLKDAITKPLVNTVICSSILKGFAYTKDTDKVMALYKEMQAHKIQPNTITFNTILNAFAQCGAMQYAPELLEDMKSAVPPVEPDIVTYSTLVKGYCFSGCLDQAFQVFTNMQQEGKCAPDEVLFNSLLGGCAKEFRLDHALELLNDMKKFNVTPSNYTLSMLVKLMCRCRRLEQAFAVLEDISKEYNFKINIQVYTCLIQGCFHNGQTDKALSVYEKIIKEGLIPDAMTYTVLVRGCLRAGSVEKAVELLKHSHGIGLGASKSKAEASMRGESEETLLASYNTSKRVCVGTDGACLDEVIVALGGPNSKEGEKLLADLRACGPSAQSSSTRPTKQWQKS